MKGGMSIQPLDSSYFSPARVIPASELPAEVSLSQKIYGSTPWMEISFQFEVARVGKDQTPNSPSSLYNPEGDLSFDLIARLAKGEAVPANHPGSQEEIPGTLRLFWWETPQLIAGESYSDYFSPLLEFIPERAVEQGQAFCDWQQLRFPQLGIFSSFLQEDIKLGLHAIWRGETCPPSTIEPDDSLLYEACVENHARLAAAILQGRRVEASPSRANEITETALGVAMENQGKFEASIGFLSRCHRNYRDDDYTLAEDEATWMPRAEQIETMLREAGAIDYSPLLEDSLRGDVDEVRRMLDAGFPPNFAIYGYSTALREAVRGKHPEVCRLLLSRGVDPNQSRPFSTTMVYGGTSYPLGLALNNPEILKLLLEAGADPTICRDDIDRTPVIFRGNYGTAENAAALFRRVDFASVRSAYGKTGVHFLSAEDLVLCREFITPELLDLPDLSGRTPLVEAIMEEMTDKARLLLSMGASPTKTSWVSNAMLWNFHALRKLIPCLLTPAQAVLLVGDLKLLEEILALAPNPSSVAYRLKMTRVLSSAELLDLNRRIQEDEDNHQANPSLNRVRVDFDSLYCALEGELGELLKIGPRLSLDGQECQAIYPELVEAFDVLEFGQNNWMAPHLLATWENSFPLTASKWLGLATEAIEEAREAAAQFAQDLSTWHASDETEEEETPHYQSMLRLIDQGAEYLERARAIMQDREPKPQTVSAQLCAIASKEFQGGQARARKNVAQNEGVEFDDFLDALRENLAGGSTMDLGKLAQAARSRLAQLDLECVELMKQI